MAPRNPSQCLCFTVAVALFMSLTVGVSTPAPILTIKSPDGDVIQCVSRDEQPSLRHPSLQNHKLQETPTDMVQKEEEYGWQVWHSAGYRCPEGTIPIRKFDGILPSATSDRDIREHQYAIAYVDSHPHIYGTKATISVWDPIVHSPADFSLAQVWLVAGQYKTNDLNTIEAGWQVFPKKYGDHQPRLFTFWTRDAYVDTGCYSLHCAGFVQVSRSIALEAAISPTSIVGGDRVNITIKIWKDRVSGNWWLGMGANVAVVPIGYWPEKIFTTLSDHATMVQWGGEVFYNISSNMSYVPQMGSGERAKKGNASYFCDLEIAEVKGTFLPVQTFQVKEDYPYAVKKSSSTACGNYFYYGGPGLGPLRSAAVCSSQPKVIVVVFFILFFRLFL